MISEFSMVAPVPAVRRTSASTRPEEPGRRRASCPDGPPAAVRPRYPEHRAGADIMRSADPVRVVVADDHTLLREAVRDILDAEAGLHVVGEAGDGNATVAVASATHPDVMLLDFDMPAHRPAETLRKILAVSPSTRVIVLTMYDNADFVQQMLEAGASGYLHKSVSSRDLILTVAGVAARDRDHLVTISVSRQTASRQARGPGAPGPAGEAGDRPNRAASALSRREEEVLALVAVALSNRQIGGRLSITEGTVKRHLRNIFDKLGAVSRIDAVNKGRRGGLLDGYPGGLPTGSLPGRFDQGA